MKTLAIVMSVYNGEKYLKTQLDSILAQDCETRRLAAFRVVIRDDGSSDGTRALLETYASQNPARITWYAGENVGVIRSFFDALTHAGEADYYAFCDQDDYWLPGKLSRAVEMLEPMAQEIPLLYCCRPTLVDGELQPLTSEIVRPPMRPGFRNALIENIVTGCTAVYNRTLREMVLRELPKFTVMHDWWLYLTASCFGKCIYDETSFILYRQHQGNVLGSKTKRWDELKDRLRRFRGNRGNISRQAGEFVRIFGKEDAGNANMALAREFLAVRNSFPARIRFLKSAGIYRQRREDDRIFRVILYMGNY